MKALHLINLNLNPFELICVCKDLNDNSLEERIYPKKKEKSDDWLKKRKKPVTKDMNKLICKKKILYRLKSNNAKV